MNLDTVERGKLVTAAAAAMQKMATDHTVGHPLNLDSLAPSYTHSTLSTLSTAHPPHPIAKNTHIIYVYIDIMYVILRRYLMCIAASGSQWQPVPENSSISSHNTTLVYNKIRQVFDDLNFDVCIFVRPSEVHLARLDMHIHTHTTYAEPQHKIRQSLIENIRKYII